MKHSREFWIRDMEQLLDETVVTDAVAQILEKFDEAVAALNPDSRDLITRYFDGVTVEEIGRDHAVSAETVSAWIERVKRELAQQIRAKCLIKQ
ncbi:hypothetical protein K2X33_16400 [bacterium]|nr:hypothetical protein [bacterium]